MDVWDLVLLAFGLRDSQMARVPPGSIRKGFDIQTTASATGTVEARLHVLQMLQPLPEDRFHRSICVGITRYARWLFMRCESRQAVPNSPPQRRASPEECKWEISAYR